MEYLKITTDDLKEGNRQKLGQQIGEYLEFIDADLKEISRESNIPESTIEMITLGTCPSFNSYLDLIKFLKLKPELSISADQTNPILLY